MTPILQIVLLGLEIFKEILTDIPKEQRQQAWKDFFLWVKQLQELDQQNP